MNDSRDNLGLRVAALVLGLLTVAAVVFALINFQQRLSFDVPDDGISWLDNSQGVQAMYVGPHSPGDRAGIRPGDQLLAIDGVRVHRAVDVMKRLWAQGFGRRRITR